MWVCMCVWACGILYDWIKFWSAAKNAMNLKWSFLPSPASSMFFGCPHRSSMIRLLSAALRSCSFFNSSAAFFLNNSYKASVKEEQILLTRTKKKNQNQIRLQPWNPILYPGPLPSHLRLFTRQSLTRSFFFLSGVMNPFLAFFALDASSIRLRTSALLRSISACFAFLAYTRKKLYIKNNNIFKQRKTIVRVPQKCIIINSDKLTSSSAMVDGVVGYAFRGNKNNLKFKTSTLQHANCFGQAGTWYMTYYEYNVNNN